MSRNIVLLTWNSDSKAYKALSDLKGKSPDTINQAVVVTRLPDGKVEIRDGGSNVAGLSTLEGSILGGLVGILGGPLGVLLGFSTGALFGNLIDMDSEIDDTSVLSQISKALGPGMTGLVVDLEEDDPKVIDTIVTTSDATILRRPYDEVYNEVVTAEDAADSAAREAAKSLRDAKKVVRKEEREERWDKIKQKFSSIFS